MNASSAIAGQPARILVVDDDRGNREVLEMFLECEDFRILTAASGEEALASVAQQPPDLILLDIMMPGMDGYEVATRIKGHPATKNIPIMMVTALDDRNARVLALRAGAEDFLVKPIDRAETCLRVRNLLRKTHGGSPIEGAPVARLVSPVVAMPQWPRKWALGSGPAG